MRYPAAEKLEVIRLVERSHLPVRRTLRHEARALKEVVAEQALELRLLKKSMTGAGDDQG